MAKQNFFDDLDLRYGEIAIAMTQIDRMNPGEIPFTIPVLTPNMNNDAINSNKVVQNDKSNIMNVDSGAVDVSNLEVGNTIYIEIPKEYCALPGAVYDITGDVVVDGKYDMSGTGNMDMQANVNANGAVSSSGTGSLSGFSLSGGTAVLTPFSVGGVSGNGGMSINGAGKVNLDGSISGTTESGGTGHINIDGTIVGTITEVLNDCNRYIPPKSRWLVMFIGGDINNPVIIGRLPDIKK